MTDEKRSAEPPAETENQPSSQTPMVPPTPQQGEVATRRSSNSNQEENKTTELAQEFRTAERWIIGTNISLGIIGIIALFIYYGQLRQMKKATEKAGISADAAKSAADTASAALKATQNAMRIDQRAWVGLNDITPLVFEIGKKLETRIWFKNTGKTPARNVNIAMRLDAVGKDDTPSFELNPPISHSLMTPGGDVSVMVSEPRNYPGGLSKAGFEVIDSGSQIVYIDGIVRYEDVFGFKHWSTFCGRLVPKTKVFEACRTHNDTDDELR